MWRLHKPSSRLTIQTILLAKIIYRTCVFICVCVWVYVCLKSDVQKVEHRRFISKNFFTDFYTAQMFRIPDT